MTHYIDGFVVPVPRRNVPKYLRMARKAGRLLREHGALECRECIGDDLKATTGTPFPRGIKAKHGETVVFSWVMFKSKAHRDRVNAEVMKDPRFASMCDAKGMPFDCNRVLYGGFKAAVES